MTKIWKIYVLKDPRNGEVRYVGKTTDEAWRESSHRSIHNTIGKPRVKWIRELKDAGYEPVFEIVDSCVDDQSDRVEFYWIMRHLAQGARLTNSRMTTGGNYAAKLTKEHKEMVKRLARERGMRETAVLWLLLEFATIHPFEDVLEGVYQSLSLSIE